MKKGRTKVKRELYRGFVIRMLRPDYVMVDKYTGGKRIRKCYPTLKEAKVFIDQQTIDIKNLGASAFDLTPAQRLDAKQALELLAGSSTLSTAARFWLRHNPSGDAVTLKALGEQFLADLLRRGCRKTTYAERRQKINRLCEAHGERPAVSVTAPELVTWMDEKGLTGATADGYRRMFRAWFNYGVKQGILEANPVDRIERSVMDEKMPVFWPVKTIEALLCAAEQTCPDMVPSLAIMAFAGLRPGEVAGLTWEHVDLAERIIRVTPESSKVRRARIVEISENLVQWLAPHQKKSGAVSPAPMTFRRARARIMQSAGIKTWIPDVLRHSYATFHFAQHQDAGKLAAQMGHIGDAGILYKHYRGLATPKEAAKFWAITPHVEDNVIQLGAAG